MYDAAKTFGALPAKGSLAALAGMRLTHFVRDARFGSDGAGAPDVTARAANDRWQAGYDEGLEEARASAARGAEALSGASAALGRALSRIDDQQAADLTERLRDTVVALCSSVIDNAAIDPDALARRIAAALSMLRRSDDERLLRVHPDDADLLASWLPEDVTVLPDLALDRGSIRLETSTGGLESGPRQWREAIAAAVRGC